MFRFKSPGGAQSGLETWDKIFQNFSIKYHEQKFAFSGRHWTGLSNEKFKNSGFRVLIKISISVLNFSTESVKKPRIYDLLFLIATCSPKNDSKHPSEMRNKHHNSYFTTIEVFPGLVPILMTGHYWLAVEFLQIYFCLQIVLWKITVS